MGGSGEKRGRRRGGGVEKEGDGEEEEDAEEGVGDSEGVETGVEWGGRDFDLPLGAILRRELGRVRLDILRR